MKDKTIFDYLNALFDKRNIEYDKKIASAYILTLWLSHDKELIGITNDINEHIFKMKDEIIWKYYFDKIPKKKRLIKWFKKDKEKTTLEKKLIEKYRLSSKEAKVLSLMIDEKCLGD